MKKILALIFGLIALPAFAATTPNSFVTPQTPTRGVQRFVQGTDSPFTQKTLYTAGANGSRCYSIMESNTEATVTHSIVLFFVSGGASYVNVQYTTAAAAGNLAGVPPDNVLKTFNGALPVDQYGNSFIQLMSGDSLTVEYVTALSTGTAINFLAFCSDF